MSTSAVKSSPGGFLKISIQTEVSTSTTRCLTFVRASAVVAPHFREVSLPQPSSGQLQDSTSLRSPNEVLESPVHGGGKRSFTTQTGGFFQQFLIKHKICTFHVYIVPSEKRKQHREPLPGTRNWFHVSIHTRRVFLASPSLNLRWRQDRIAADSASARAHPESARNEVAFAARSV